MLRTELRDKEMGGGSCSEKRKRYHRKMMYRSVKQDQGRGVIASLIARINDARIICFKTNKMYNTRSNSYLSNERFLLPWLIFLLPRNVFVLVRYSKSDLRYMELAKRNN